LFIFSDEERWTVDCSDYVLATGLEIMDNSVMSRPKDERAEQALFAPREDSLDDLIARGRDGDALALEAIYYRYKTALFNMAYRYTYDRSTAEDLLQEIFIKVFTHLGDIRTTQTFTGWVYRIALNTCYSHLRGKRVELQKNVPLAEVEGTLHEVQENSSARDVRKPLDDAIAGLPRRLKEIFLLHDVQGFKHGEIARMLGLSVGTSKSQLFKARQRIREFLKERKAC
jgi:RNA polymerase sigma-70 factor (ECF subfamily)